ncbi:MAG: hypothetical protein WA708_03935 [Acidobacteriaceae bacterium]
MRLFTERKSAIWLCFAFASVLVAAPVFAQGAPQAGDVNAPPPPPAAKRMAPLPPLPPPPNQAERDAQRTVPGAYRLIYTSTEMDGSRKAGSQHYAIVLDADAPSAKLRIGTRVPIATSQAYGNVPNQQQISYIDIGLEIDARLRQYANGLELRTAVEQSELDTQKSGTPDPVIRHTRLESSVLLNEGKPVILGTLDTPGSTHSIEIMVELTRLR